MHRTLFRKLTIAAALILLGTAPMTARAQDASAWDTEPHASARLLAGALIKRADPEYLRAGIEIRLDPGWKTYWRDPGDTGVPPTFDFAGSKNIASVAVQWPAPEQFSDGAGGHSIGYVGDVILPLRITPKNAAAPSALRVKLGYAICGTLCVPAEAELELALSGNGAEDTALQRAELRVPRHVALGPGKDLAILAVHREPGGAHDRVVVDVAAPVGKPVQLFVEGPTPDWSLPMPEPDGPATAATRQFSFALDDLPPGAEVKGATLTITAVTADDAIEVPARLD